MLGYAPVLEYTETQVQNAHEQPLMERLRALIAFLCIGLATLLPFLKGYLLPPQGQGPTMKFMLAQKYGLTTFAT